MYQAICSGRVKRSELVAWLLIAMGAFSPVKQAIGQSSDAPSVPAMALLIFSKLSTLPDLKSYRDVEAALGNRLVPERFGTGYRYVFENKPAWIEDLQYYIPQTDTPTRDSFTVRVAQATVCIEFSDVKNTFGENFTHVAAPIDTRYSTKEAFDAAQRERRHAYAMLRYEVGERRVLNFSFNHLKCVQSIGLVQTPPQ